jgi:hypothetical protein
MLFRIDVRVDWRRGHRLLAFRVPTGYRAAGRAMAVRSVRSTQQPGREADEAGGSCSRCWRSHAMTASGWRSSPRRSMASPAETANCGFRCCAPNLPTEADQGETSSVSPSAAPGAPYDLRLNTAASADALFAPVVSHEARRRINHSSYATSAADSCLCCSRRRRKGYIIRLHETASGGVATLRLPLRRSQSGWWITSNGRLGGRCGCRRRLRRRPYQAPAC